MLVGVNENYIIVFVGHFSYGYNVLLTKLQDGYATRTGVQDK